MRAARCGWLAGWLVVGCGGLGGGRERVAQHTAVHHTLCMVWLLLLGLLLLGCCLLPRLAAGWLADWLGRSRNDCLAARSAARLLLGLAGWLLGCPQKTR